MKKNINYKTLNKMNQDDILTTSEFSDEDITIDDPFSKLLQIKIDDCDNDDFEIVKPQQQRRRSRSVPPSETKNIKSTICKSVIKKEMCIHINCRFAHSRKELQPIACRNKTKCKARMCLFIHPHETVDIYCDRIGLFTPYTTPRTTPSHTPSHSPKNMKKK